LIFFAICLLIVIFPLSFSLPFIHPFCCCFIVFSSFSFFYFIVFNFSYISSFCLPFFCLSYFLRSLRFLHFSFCLLHLCLHFIFLCSHVYLLKEGACILSSYASHSCMYKIDHFKCQGITCGHNRCF
jgi:hypothetical protein